MKLQTRLFNDLLWDIREQDTRFRIHTFANDLRWIAGHLLSKRTHLAQNFGLPLHFRYMPLFLDSSKVPATNFAFDPAISYPDLTEIIRTWNTLAPELEAVLDQIPDQELTMPFPYMMASGAGTLLDVLSYMASHESYHLGQMSMIRGALGLPAARLESTK